MFELCPLPAPPKLDLQTLFKNTTKPAPKSLPRNGREPLKVLHFSDYHLDLRYVVGSEADCTSPVCCRVYPYSNASVPVEESASLFGNYLCDTPEALATSVFRAVPKVTGFDVDEFAFGIYTGDLVSHDLWELTKEYVLAEELSSYQQFFNGLGGVSLYPTLGNHDTFPHAFKAFPNQDSEIYRAITKDGLVIISLNSDAWYYFNFHAYIGGNVPDHTGMFSVFIDYLLEAEEADQAVRVIQHVNTGGSTDYEGLPAPTDLWYAIIDRFNNTIRGNFFGHTHEDEFGVVYSNNATVQNANTAAAVSWIMPSVTTYTNLNSEFRYYLVDPDTSEVMDSITYYANVSDTDSLQAEGDAEWKFEYSARETYNYDGKWPASEPLTPAFWHGVAIDVKANQTTFETYTDLRTKKFRPYANVTGAERILTICGLFSMSGVCRSLRRA
ncbi:Metallo-dependent phosphatase [Teratosphaeria nubilosa]|uniref:Metallo-dependent phosphatase n=1 Tax=Teratosphaeria nubilosa TaxID=161662 RepID=A0A6G1LFP4_9PEZI|nr:Metallo-dependent phosphatase [Teratosphaeria nubilosa]